MKTLADVLGVPDPNDETTSHQSVAPAPKLSAKKFCRQVLESAEYRASLLRRIILDELPPAVECKMYEYAYGKPIARVELEDKTRALESVSLEELQARARTIDAYIQTLMTSTPVLDDDDDEPLTHDPAVH